MTTVKTKNQQDLSTDEVSEDTVRCSPILLFILASVLVHGLGMLGFYRLERAQISEKKVTEPTPIEFVEIPEESTDEPPPETQRRAINNSVAKSKEKPVTTPKVADKTTTPTPKTTIPNVVPKPQPAPLPQPQPVKPPPVTKQPPVLSGADSTTITKNEPAEKPTTTPKTESKKSPPNNSPVATRLPPKIKPTSPKTTESPVKEPTNSAASLLGGSYQRSLKDDGGGSFFESEILASRNAPYAQLDAQQDRMMAAYFAEIRRRIKRNWSPDSPTDEYNTVLNFSIQRSGQVTGLRVVKTSGSEKVDRETIKAVQDSAPFAPLPESFPLDNLDIQFNFNIYLF